MSKRKPKRKFRRRIRETKRSDSKVSQEPPETAAKGPGGPGEPRSAEHVSFVPDHPHAPHGRADLLLLERLLKHPQYQADQQWLEQEQNRVRMIAFNVAPGKTARDSGEYSETMQMRAFRLLFAMQAHSWRQTVERYKALETRHPQVHMHGHMFVTAEQRRISDILIRIGCGDALEDVTGSIDRSGRGVPPISSVGGVGGVPDSGGSAVA